MNILNFKKEFFGFNKNDVTRYIAEMIETYEKHTDELNGEINRLKEQNRRLVSRNSELEIKQAETEKLREKTEKLAETVGNLYILAKSGATQILNDAEHCADEVYKQAENNISAVLEAQNELKAIDSNLKSVSGEFSNSVQKLSESLDSVQKGMKDSLKNSDSYKQTVLSALSDD